MDLFFLHHKLDAHTIFSVSVCRWAGVIWEYLGSPPRKLQTWIWWLLRGCYFQTSTLPTLCVPPVCAASCLYLSITLSLFGILAYCLLHLMLPTINVLSNSTVGYNALLNNSELVNELFILLVQANNKVKKDMLIISFRCCRTHSSVLCLYSILHIFANEVTHLGISCTQEICILPTVKMVWVAVCYSKYA